ncbi:helix-turn-helix transcriptional regulator [Bradyrhizobium sp. SZCCHNS1012]|uniref:helix-turn-helix domain-containing protein n=1 Tax=Bradyrhizobium sp. SZCCHNS1012 TaxID=3057297 RepID=UPI0029161D78|nr:helix-turn-helix transcriptional regulator [Bradyrhizobium sp. SZCCHNS1012]
MSDEISFAESPAPVRKARKPKAYPNRIAELIKERKWTYAEVAARIRKLAAERGDTGRTSVHEVSVNRLAIGSTTLSQEWMNVLGEVFGVPPAEIISPPAAKNHIRVRVTHAFEGGKWHQTSTLPEAKQFDLMVQEDDKLRGATLYAGEIRGPSNNLRYPPRSIVILSKVEQKPGEIAAGKRYHVRMTRKDGMVEDSIKLLSQAADGSYWLKPESDHPNHQQWARLDDTENAHIELVGRVRRVFSREDD